MVAIKTKCPFCGKEQIIRVPEEGIIAYKAGALMQDAFPMLTPDEREALISGICPECWDKTFGAED